MNPLNKIVEAALDYGFMCEVTCGTQMPSMAMLAKYVADWPEIKEGHELLMKQRAQREAVEAERNSGTRTVASYSGMEPRKEYREHVFRDHNCGGCSDGERPCREGNYNNCSNPRARND
jgi:hypothetical protein